MTRRTALSALSVPLLTPAAAPPDRPNVVLIVTDDQGWFDVRANGNPHIRTPHIDRLAAEGTRFTHFYCSPVCAPTRAALMTGRHYQRTGAVDTYLGRDTLDEREVTLGQVMQKGGYRTACIGKWHLGRYMRYHPTRRGFDEFFGFWQYGFINQYEDSDELVEGSTPVSADGYITDVLTSRAISFIERNRTRPFFLYLAYNAPHAPHLVPDAYIAPYLKDGLPLDQARIYGMVTAIDDNIGRLLETIDKQNTLVVFMTDNGGVSRFHRAGLRGNKGSVYEGGVRVPFVARWPGQIAPGAVVDAPAQHIDVLPTLCALTGVSPPARPLDGKSLAAHLRTGKGETPHRYIYHQWNRGRPVLATVPGDAERKANWAICDARSRMKLHASGELYDLRSDPGETRDIAAQNAAAAAALRSEFERWFAQVTDRAYERVPIEIGRSDEDPVEIDVTWGEAAGKRVRPRYNNYNRDFIDGWTEEGDSVRWKVDVVTPGAYDLILSYGCEPGKDGARGRVRLGRASLEFAIAPRPGRMMFVRERVGSLQLDRGPALLEVTALGTGGRELGPIHKIWLRRADAARH